MSKQGSSQAGILVIGDEIYRGTLFGAEWSADASDRSAFGEVVFNTSMTGYQEVLTDPSYAGQMVVFTAAHIGNTGANQEDLESTKVYARGVVIGQYVDHPSNFRSKQSLDQFLKDNKTVGIHGVDTRALTLELRKQGVVPGMILPAREEKNLAEWKKKWLGIDYGSIDWIKNVTTKEPYRFQPKPFEKVEFNGKKHNVVVYDYGVKRQLLVDLAKRGCDLTVVPADYPADKVLALNPEGIFLSNGPGDPKLATYAVSSVKTLLGKKPIFGVCMGHQVLGMAMGAKTYKLKFGHRGGNQPVKNITQGSVEISSHNHGYAVDVETLPSTAKLTHQNLNDECCEGLSVPSMNAFSVQYHPESSPGPHDSSYLFDQFIQMMK
ncbi:MAG: glutamine-hydrolyzing carbamoyl-phosphate synthase small subunit [Bdellovibrionales bacterium]|nr:glutamine-hydrolyzing carbamoyl-phosphate synthase small subunit [Bdellovibrionales bacterium]